MSNTSSKRRCTSLSCEHEETYAANQQEGIDGNTAVTIPERIDQEDVIFTCNACGLECYNLDMVQSHFAEHRLQKAQLRKEYEREHKTKQAVDEHRKIHLVSEQFQPQIKQEMDDQIFCEEIEKSLARLWKRVTRSENRHVEAETCVKIEANEDLISSENFVSGIDMQPNLSIKTEKQGEDDCISHMKKGLYECTICSKRFTTNYSLQRHSSIHTGEKPHQCQVCMKRFRCKDHMDAHVKIHTGIKNHVCKICGEGFMKRYRFNSHIKRLHKGLGIKPKPIRTGPPYTCKTCSKNLSSIMSLRRHNLVHTGERLFTCTVCDKKFQRKYHLKRHTKTHKT